MSYTKICPYCAEEINTAAIVCKHCGRELNFSQKTELVPPQPEKKKKRGYIWIIVIAFLVIFRLLNALNKVDSYTIDHLLADWNLNWNASRSAYIGGRVGVAQISLKEFEEGYVIHTLRFDDSDDAAEYVEEFQKDAIRAVLPSGPIETAIWEYVLGRWDHFWEISQKNSEYYSSPIRGRDVYYEITLDRDGVLEEVIGVGKYKGGS